MNEGYELLNTPGRGEGIFATRQFHLSDIVMIGAIEIDDLEANHSHASQMGEFRYALHAGMISKVNHSCSPNCELIRLTKYTMGLVAICNIEPGMEINYDYQWPALDWIPECGCGAANCRGWVVAEEELSEMRKLAKKRKPK